MTLVLLYVQLFIQIYDEGFQAVCPALSCASPNRRRCRSRMRRSHRSHCSNGNIAPLHAKISAFPPSRHDSYHRRNQATPCTSTHPLEQSSPCIWYALESLRCTRCLDLDLGPGTSPSERRRRFVRTRLWIERSATDRNPLRHPLPERWDPSPDCSRSCKSRKVFKLQR